MEETLSHDIKSSALHFKWEVKDFKKKFLF